MLTNREYGKENLRAEKGKIQNLEDNSNEFPTADELHEIMSTNDPFEGEGDKAITAQDLVLIYKNIENGSKPMEQSSKSSNQYVESIIYNDPGSEGSDTSENVSNEEWNDIFTGNKERIDPLNNLQDTLCHKFGNMFMQTSNLTTEYYRQFLFNQPFNKGHHKNFHTLYNSKHSDSTVLPASLLNYICCKRHEDNYNSYMDNVIIYVQHIIEQLKRISNGDYLTEKAKEKWREINDGNSQAPDCKRVVLTNAVSIPLRAEGEHRDRKSTGTWDDAVHSEIDIRSLSKILNKKIIVEVPKILCGTYRLFSKRYKDNLIITCKKDTQTAISDVKEKESSVNVILKLQYPKCGLGISNTESLVLLKSLPSIKRETCSNDVLALEYKQDNPIDQKTDINDKFIELDENRKEIFKINTIIENGLTAEREAAVGNFPEANYDFSSQRSEDIQDDLNQNEAKFNLILSDDLHGQFHRLNMQPPLLEENEDTMKKRKSPTRVRIKSPYENRSYVIEEKKRKKLLEIREKRVKRKNAINENCKIIKHKYGRGAIMPQSSNSVTKLSITNKSFYNSIYGQTLNINNKSSRKYHNHQSRDIIPGIEVMDHEENRGDDSTVTTPEKSRQKYINRNCYLDDADTAVMYMQIKQNEHRDETKDTSTPSTSTNYVGVNLKTIDSSATDFSLTDTSSSLYRRVLFNNDYVNTEDNDTQENVLMPTRKAAQVTVPTSTPKKERNNEDDTRKMTPSLECRRSIDKIYDFMKKNAKSDNSHILSGKINVVNDTAKLSIAADRGDSTSVQASDSGTSVKHQLTSNASSFSFKKAKIGVKTVMDTKKKHEQPILTIPKVIISSKLQSSNFNNKPNIKENKRLSPDKIQENPLKAISQLLHEFDNVQKTRQLKRNKKPEDKSSSRQLFYKRSPKENQHLKETETVASRFPVLKERKHQGSANESVRISHQQFRTEENVSNKINRKKIADSTDEEKELRGEAVRGPSKKLARLNSLAQPKKTYVQTRPEEIHNRFGKRFVADRQQKLRTAPVFTLERNIGSTSLKNKQGKCSEVLPVSNKQLHTAVRPSETVPRARHSTNYSPTRNKTERGAPVPANRPPYKHSKFNDTPELIEGKMMVVETYVNNHYGSAPQRPNCGDCHCAQKSTVPLIPTDIDLASMTSSPSPEGSTALGETLHFIIDSLIKTNVPVLSALAECNESSTSKLGKDEDVESFIKDTSQLGELLSGSEHPGSMLEDKNMVAVISTIFKDIKDEAVSDSNENTNVSNCNTSKCSTKKLLILENALYSQLSSSTFQKQLGLKNLMLITNQSMEKLSTLQSGDGGSLVLHPTLSQNIEAKTDVITELKILPMLSYIDNKDHSVNITTMGHYFPHSFVKCHSMTKLRTSDDEDSEFIKVKSTITYQNIYTKFNKSIQRFKGVYKEAHAAPIEHGEVGICSTMGIYQVDMGNCKGCGNKAQSIKDTAITAETIGISDTDPNKENSDNISNSTSLDILVRILNEIKNITYSQAHLTNHENACKINLESKDLETILSKTVLRESSVDYSVNNEISASFDNLQQLEALPSNYSFYISSNIEEYKDNLKLDKNVTKRTCLSYQAINIDKEVNEKISKREHVHRFTEVPSRFFPISIGTSVTDSLIKLINKSSSQSMYSFTDCQSFNTPISNAIKELPCVDTGKTIHDTVHSHLIFENHKILDKKKYVDNLKSQAMESYNYTTVEFEPVMKMKRDVLVTVYSILIITVFAALSFPEIVHFV